MLGMGKAKLGTYQVVRSPELDEWISKAQRARPGVSVSRLLHDALIGAPNPFDQLRVVIASGGTNEQGKTPIDDEADVPIFVPTFDPPKKLTVKEDKVDGSSAAAAAKALAAMRRKKK